MTTQPPKDNAQDPTVEDADGLPLETGTLSDLQDALETEAMTKPEGSGTSDAGIGAPEDTILDKAEVLAEFEDYELVESETIGEHASDRDAAYNETVTIEDPESEETPLETPKERLLADLRLEAKVEAVLFASQKPLKTSEIFELLNDSEIREKDIQVTLEQLVEAYERRCGGFKLHYLKRLGYQFQTAQEAGHIMERMFASRPRPISRAALETLAIIAYRQPVTRAEVEFIRGVDAGSIFKTLLERELIKCVGRKEIVGRPMMFGTTDEFLKVFNLSSIKDLPPLESFQPSREMVQGALDKLGEGDTPVDVEEYIAESTGAEYVSDAEGEEWDESVLDESNAEGNPNMTRLQGATIKGSNDEDLMSGSLEEPTESEYGTDPNSEMVIPNGPSITPGGGELD